MKRNLFLCALSLLLSGFAMSQVNISLSVTPVSGQPCSRVLNIHTDGYWYKFNVRRAWPVPAPGGSAVFMYAYPPNNPPYGGFHTGPHDYQIAVNSPVSVLYKIELTDITNPNPTVSYITVSPAPCNFKAVKLGPGSVPNGRIALPEDPDEDPTADMEVSWKLEEIDMTTGESVFTLQDPLNWASSNVPGASNAFNGFDGFNTAASVAALQAGDVSVHAGTFDPDKTYRITRAVKFPDEDEWLESRVYIGPDMDDVLEEPWDGSEEERAIIIGQAGTPDLLTLGQDRDNKIVTFHTTLDEGKIMIYDATGSKIKEIDLKKESFDYELNVAAFAKGMYVTYLESLGQTIVKKFAID